MARRSVTTKEYDVDIAVNRGTGEPVIKKYKVSEKGKEITICPEGGDPVVYVRKRLPDVVKRARLIERAKGDRSLARFAEDCNTSASTLSRFITGNNGTDAKDSYSNKPMGVTLVLAIVDNAQIASDRPDRPWNRISVEELMAVNGYLLPDDSEYRDESYEIRREGEQDNALIDNVKSEFVRTLMNEEYMVGTANWRDLPESRYGLPLRGYGTWIFRVIRGDEDLFWIVNSSMLVEHPDRRRIIKTILEYGAQSVFLRDLWDPKSLSNVRYTILLPDEDDIVDSVMDLLKDIRVNNYISIRGVSIFEDKGLLSSDEYVFPKIDGEEKQ